MNDLERLNDCLGSLYGMSMREAVPILVECISDVSGVDWAVSWDINPHNSHYLFGSTTVSFDLLRSIIMHADINRLEELVAQIILNCPSDEPRFENYVPARTLSWEPEPTPRSRRVSEAISAISDALESEIANDAYRVFTGAIEPEVATEPIGYDGLFTANAFRRFHDRMFGTGKRNRDDDRLKEGDNKMIDDFLNEYQAK